MRGSPGFERRWAIRALLPTRAAARTKVNDERTRLMRWRPGTRAAGGLGSGAEQRLGCCPDGVWKQRDEAISYLYDREYGPGRNVRTGGIGPGSLDGSQLTVPDWINAVHELFPRKTIERIE